MQTETKIFNNPRKRFKISEVKKYTYHLFLILLNFLSFTVSGLWLIICVYLSEYPLRSTIYSTLIGNMASLFQVFMVVVLLAAQATVLICRVEYVSSPAPDPTETSPTSSTVQKLLGKIKYRTPDMLTGTTVLVLLCTNMYLICY